MGLPLTTGVGGVPPAKLSHTHEQIINWLILNPDRSMRECADTFGYTQSWLSTLVRSDLFQAALAERQHQVALRVVQSIPQKLAAVADMALDKLADMVQETEDKEFILDAADKALHRMGYAPQSSRNPAGSPGQFSQGGVSIQQNNFVITAGDLEEARALMQNSAACLPTPMPPIQQAGEKEIQGEVVRDSRPAA